MGIYVVSEYCLYRDLIASYCEGEGFRVLGACASLADLPALSQAREGSLPHVVLHVPEMSELTAAGIRDFKARSPGSCIVALASSLLPEQMIRDLAAQVDATVSDDRSLHTLTSILTVVEEGFHIKMSSPCRRQADNAPLIDRRVQSKPFRSAQRMSETALSATLPAEATMRKDPAAASSESNMGAFVLAKLSCREREVLSQVRDGKSNKDIAKDLEIVESTVKVHLRGCFRKIGAQNRTQAAVWATQHLTD